MKERRLAVVARAVLALLGVAVSSLFVLLAATEVGAGAQGDSAATWVGLALFVGAGVAGWLAVWAAAGYNPLGRERPDATRTPRRLELARLMLALSALLLGYFLLGLPLPPTHWRDTAATFAILAMLAATLYAAITITHRDPRGRHVALALGAWMTSEIVHATWSLARRPGNPDAGPATVLAVLTAWTCCGAAILAALCVVSLRGTWPPRNPAPASGVVS